MTRTGYRDLPVACEWLIGTRRLDYERIYLLATVAAVAASELWSFSHYHRASSSTMLMLLSAAAAAAAYATRTQASGSGSAKVTVTPAEGSPRNCPSRGPGRALARASLAGCRGSAAARPGRRRGPPGRLGLGV